MRTEQEIQREILDWLKAEGILAWKVPIGPMLIGSGRARNPLKGHPDIAFVYKGRYGGLEVKRPKGPSPYTEDQARWKDDLTRAGALCGMVTSVDEARALVYGSLLCA